MFGVLSLAPCYVRKSRYVTKASLCHIAMERQCLRWWMTARPCIHPLHNQKKLQKFYIYADVSHTHPAGAGFFFGRNESDCSLMHELLYTFDTVTWQGLTQYVRKLMLKLLEGLGSHRGSSYSRPFAMCRPAHPMPWLPSMSRKAGPLKLKL